MKLCTCKHCHKTFYSRNASCTCQDCRDIDDAVFMQIKAYLKYYPFSSAVQIAEALGLAVPVVLKYIEEGRLAVSHGRFERL